MTVDLQEFNDHRQTIRTRAGDVAYVDVGSGPAALFVHGVLTSSFLWANVIGEVANDRRCLALDLPGHGRSPLPPTQPAALRDLAEVLAAFCEAVGVDSVDLVANDTGGAVAQIFAVGHRPLLRTLVLTNCDVRDQLPPEAFQFAIDAARAGLLAPALVDMAGKPDAARQAFGSGFEHPERLSDQSIGEFFRPFAELEGAEAAQRVLVEMDAADLAAVDAGLAALDVPTLMVWGTDDQFFDVKWAHWLNDTIPGAVGVVEVTDGKLFWPAERPAELVTQLRGHWAAHPPTRVGR